MVALYVIMIILITAATWHSPMYVMFVWEVVLSAIFLALTAAWRHTKRSAELEPWFERINTAFFRGKLPPTKLTFWRDKMHTLGSCYCSERDGHIQWYGININALHLINLLPAHLLAVLAHEQIHLWEFALRGRKCDGRPYHTKLFREKCTKIGIPTNEHGHYLGITNDSAFARLLASHGVCLPKN